MQGDSAYIGPSYFDTAGTYYETFTNANGCDSVVEISLEIIPITSDTILLLFAVRLFWR